MSRGESQKTHEFIGIRSVFDHAFLDHCSELGPEFLVIVRFIRCHLVQHIQDTPGQRTTHCIEIGILLQEFAGNVQGQVGRIDDSLDEAQVQGQELLGIVHDEYTLYIELESPRCFPVPQVERCPRRYVQEARVFPLALDPVMAPAKRVLKIVRDVLVELLVFIVADLRA